MFLQICSCYSCYLCSASSISQDQLEALQQAASFFHTSSQGTDGSSSSCTALASALASKPAAEVLRTTVQAMQASMTAMHKIQACLVAPGPLAFHHVRQVRGSMLLLDMAAVLVCQPAACKMLLREESDASGMLVTGAQFARRCVEVGQEMAQILYALPSCCCMHAGSKLACVLAVYGLLCSSQLLLVAESDMTCLSVCLLCLFTRVVISHVTACTTRRRNSAVAKCYRVPASNSSTVVPNQLLCCVLCRCHGCCSRAM
jgi:hypothetical protein